MFVFISYCSVTLISHFSIFWFVLHVNAQRQMLTGSYLSLSRVATDDIKWIINSVSSLTLLKGSGYVSHWQKQVDTFWSKINLKTA